MTIHLTAYSTTACNGQVLHKIEDGLKRAKVNGDLSILPDDGNLIYGVASSYAGAHSDVPAFYHPFLMEHNGKKQIVIDDRQFVRFNANDHQRRVTNLIEYDLLAARGRFNYIWVTRPASYMRDVSSVPAAVYVSWVSEAIARVLALDPFEQMRMAILTGVFYYSLFSSALQEDEREWQRLAVKIADAARCKAEDVFDVIDKLEGRAPKDLIEFCACSTKIVESVRLENLNAGMLITAVGNSWFGSNVRELMAVALEHPPTWFALLLTAHVDRSYRRTTIANILGRQRQQNVEQFANAITNTVKIVERDEQG